MDCLVPLEDAIRELRSSLATFATSSTMMGLEGILCNENGGFGGQLEQITGHLLLAHDKISNDTYQC